MNAQTQINEINAAKDEYQLSLLVLNYSLKLRKPPEVIEAALQEANLAFYRLSLMEDGKNIDIKV